MKLFAHNPRLFAKNSNQPRLCAQDSEIPMSERNIVFTNATKLLEYVPLLKSGQNGLDKFTWLIGTTYLWNALLYLLIEVRYRKTGPEVDNSWEVIGRVFSYYPEIFQEFGGAVYSALGTWTLEVWDTCAAASEREGLGYPSTPDYINALRQCRRPSDRPSSAAQNGIADPAHPTRNPFLHDMTQSQLPDQNNSTIDTSAPYNVPDLLSLEMDQNEWVQWEQIMLEQVGFN